MDFELSEDQRAFRDTARQFATERMLPDAARWDAEKIFPEAALREAAALGFGGIYVKDDVGGSGLSRLDAALIMEELAAACPSTAAYISIHNMAAWMIDAFGDDDQRRRFLPKLCSMQALTLPSLHSTNGGGSASRSAQAAADSPLPRSITNIGSRVRRTRRASILFPPRPTAGFRRKSRWRSDFEDFRTSSQLAVQAQRTRSSTLLSTFAAAARM